MSKQIPWQEDKWGHSQVRLGVEPTIPVNRYTLIGDRVEECKEVVVHSFAVGDVDDPDLYAAHPLWEWQESEQGKWVMEHAVESPIWHRLPDAFNFGHKYTITAKLQGARLTEWLLRNGK